MTHPYLNRSNLGQSSFLTPLAWRLSILVKFSRILPILILSTALITPISAQPSGGPPTFSVKVEKAQSRELAPTLEFTGSIEPWRVIELGSEVEGLVREIPIEEGQSLDEGMCVCELDTTAVTIEMRRLNALVDSARADYDRLVSGFRSEEIEESRKRVESAVARFERARDDLARQGPLVKQGVLTQTEGTRLEAAAREAAADLQSAQARLELLERGYRSEEVDVAKANLEMNQADLADASRRLKLHTLKTPMDCVVVERLKEPGEWVTEGEAVAQVVVLDPLRVRIEVPQIHLSKVKPGLLARIEVDGLAEQTFQAEVEHVVPRAGMTSRNFPVLMRLENPEGLLQSGLFARVRLSLGEKKSYTVVPREALQIRGESLIVLVVDPEEQGKSGGPSPGGTIREVLVRPGSEADGWVAVEGIETQGVQPGEWVVTLGGTRLVTGMPVRTLPGAGPDPAQAADAKTETSGSEATP
jgi:RND family efflux transporter MFP subunit